MAGADTLTLRMEVPPSDDGELVSVVLDIYFKLSTLEPARSTDLPWPSSVISPEDNRRWVVASEFAWLVGRCAELTAYLSKSEQLDGRPFKTFALAVDRCQEDEDARA
jgi:hypothetical protein